MPTPPLTVRGLKSFSNAAVWENHSDPSCNLPFAGKTLIYGFNGTGKSTLSRAFSSVQRGVIEEKLPEGASFEIILSDGKNVSSSKLSNPFGNNLLVFNQDFVARNFKWDESSVEPIFFLSEESIEKKKEHEEAIKEKEAAAGAEQQAQLETETADKELREFKTNTARRVRDIVPQMTQSFDARKIDSAYAEREFTKDDQLDDANKAKLQGVLSDEKPLDKKAVLIDPRKRTEDFLTKVLPSLSQTPGSIIADELSSHPTMFQWIKTGLDYHNDHSLTDCLLCGNELTTDRKAYLAQSFDSTWDEFVQSLRSTSSDCGAIQGELQSLREAVPSSNDIQQSERPAFSEAQKNLFGTLSSCQSYFAELKEAMARKIESPATSIEAPQLPEGKTLESLVSDLQKSVETVNESILRHNSLHDEFAERQEEAFLGLRNHVLAEDSAKWKKINADIVQAKENLKAAQEKKEKAEEAFRKIDNELRTHGPGAEQLNELLSSYLGHKGLKLESIETGYKLIRSDGKPAKQLSEGERTALSFCYFLTQIGAEGRDLKELVVVIDDPISSLDTSARTHAFSLLRRKTKKCAQVIVLTHNMSFMNMVKREFLNGRVAGDYSGMFMLDCKSDDNDVEKRSTSLAAMHPLIAMYDTEYHYLFDIVLDAAENDALDHYFMLPNATRKLLESFTRFAFPDKQSFAEALMSGAVEAEGFDTKSLERLVQIESHGTLEGIEELPSLTVEEALKACKAAMAYIRKRDKKHFDAMKALCNKLKAA